MKNYSKNLLQRLYITMLKIRLCEESFIEPILNREVRCPVHLYSGEEAIATGICVNLTERDYIFGTHRSHGHYLAKGGSIYGLIAEIYGKETGCSKGRGGSMHIIDPEKGIIGAAPIVGGTISLALGAALASKIRKEKRVSVSFFGDGATGEGVLYESLNFAALKKLPILFVCENNYYSTHMPIKECRPNENIYKIAEPFDIKSFKVDGNDILQVYETAKNAVNICRNENIPIFIECNTYRLRGHVGPDDNIQGAHTDIRPKEEIERWKEKDPVIKFENFLINNEFERKEIEEIKKEVKKGVREAFLCAKNSPIPKESELTKYVYKC